MKGQFFDRRSIGRRPNSWLKHLSNVPDAHRSSCFSKGHLKNTNGVMGYQLPPRKWCLEEEDQTKGNENNFDSTDEDRARI